MKKVFYSSCLALMLTGALVSCKKTSTDELAPTGLSSEDRGLVASAGFNSNWAEKTAEGDYLIEGDILMTKAQLQEMVGVPSEHELVIANNEHYRTTNVVSTPGSGTRNITVRLGAGFPSYYSTALNSALARYNSYGLRISFTRVSSGGNIVITGSALGTTSTGGCILGRASGFPTGGNPSPGFTLSTSSCAVSYLNTATKADEVIAHEIGHCIGFRHTDYMSRASCGQNSNEGSAGIGAVYIPGTPTTVSGSYNSWMMACTNGNAGFSSADGVALNFVY
jgi:Dual-action HEIGH metallo-peptidase